ncbi:hypothetical protein B0H14DRAFT_3593232 [Mycena olivaceomarginata]|nr:hypothetical protein B0H14DRAFT_3593232 [Mycena olivaceomarginata]
MSSSRLRLFTPHSFLPRTTTPTLPVADSIDGDFPSSKTSPLTISSRRPQCLGSFRQLMLGDLRVGLRLLPPKRRSGGAALPRRSASAPVTLTGNIKVLDTDGNSLGRVYQNPNNLNHFGLSIYADSTSYANTWPLMGAIDGVLQSTTATPAESGPASVSNSYPTSEPAESAIWTYNAVTQEITAQWVNSNGDKPATAISFVASSDALVITGDYGSFSSSFSSTQLVRLMFVPA